MSRSRKMSGIPSKQSHEQMEKTHFCQGLRVLAIDDNVVCLKVLAFELQKCGFQVMTTTDAHMAIEMLRKNKNGFDIVITDVMRSDIDGFKLLEIISLEMDIPVIVTSANSDVKIIEEGVKHGARDYLVKPVRLEILKNIWQHVLRKTIYCPKKPRTTGFEERLDYDTRKDHQRQEASGYARKKSRFEWTPELCEKFEKAFQLLDQKKRAIPKNILKQMNVPRLTRKQVSSHLQKFRLNLEKQKMANDSIARQESNINHLINGATTTETRCAWRQSSNSYPDVCKTNSSFYNPCGNYCFKNISPNHRQSFGHYHGRLGFPRTSEDPIKPSQDAHFVHENATRHVMLDRDQSVFNNVNMHGRYQLIPSQVHPARPFTASIRPEAPSTFNPWLPNRPNFNVPFSSASNTSGFVNRHQLSEDSSTQWNATFLQPNSGAGFFPSYFPGNSEGRDLITVNEQRNFDSSIWSVIPIATETHLTVMPIATDPPLPIATIMPLATDPPPPLQDNVDMSEESGQFHALLQTDSDKTIHDLLENEDFDLDDEIGAIIRELRTT